ncbi:MAG: hypothetical protein DMG47_16695 [Acidobacteria bacterium]|nr:MAG: hypothetical protein DMG47_16695 [Acidobacteriota bacterium]
MKPHAVVRIGLVSSILVGAFIAGQHYSRTAAAQSPQKWEYQIVGCGVGCSGQVAQINKLGAEGWEVVTLNASNRVLLKRAK